MTRTYQHIKWHRRGRVLTLTLDRPDELNAANESLHEELSHIFRDADEDPGSDVIVLTGAGRAFCAGGDVAWMQRAIDDPSLFERTCFEAKRIIFSILDCEKPIIGHINGHAIGFGCTLALFCDVTFMSADAKIGDPHVLMGVVAGDGGSIIWPQLVGLSRAKEYLMTGDAIPAVKAAEWGLVNHVLPPAELGDAVTAFADRLAGGALKAIRWTKVALNIPLRQVAHAAMDAAIAYELSTNLSEDHQEAVSAFIEKRPPTFKGK
ncbi:enoyl-CoA hydratase/isomerase family protein [uncultured Sphingomonas sp.]|uniref:enoyl-CoA hydratase/isomerase family protein n=1 Tax=uncultured Sphingomonas sp. TaxID=158754 RepID=UPI0035CB87CC